MVAVAQVDHVLNRGCSVGSVFEDVVGLSFADAQTFGDSAWPVAVGEVAVLSPIGMMRSSDQTGG